MGARRKILIVDDEPHIVELVAMNLRLAGYNWCSALDGAAALALAVSERPDLILLDLMLPGMGGMEVCATLKRDARTAAIPVIMLTARSEEDDKVAGLGVGAEDYITKPFSLREMIARIEVALRRSGRDAGRDMASGTAGKSGTVRVANLEIDREGYEVRQGGERIHLSPTEFALLTLMAENSGKALKRSRIIGTLGLAKSSTEARVLDVHVLNLRRKLGERPGGGSYVETVRGYGYRLDG